MADGMNSAEARDIAYHLHAYTNAVRHREVGPLVIERGDGAYVIDNTGKRYLEAMSGLWSVAVGFSEPRLVEAARRQGSTLPFYHSFGHKSHGPAIDLAERLIGMAPVPMSKVHFTNSGSEANDTVVKLVWYRSNAMGEPRRKKIISRLRGYHGVTVASASLTGLPNNHRSFDLPLPQVLHAGSPHYAGQHRDGETEEDFATRLANELEAMIEAEGPETVAAFIGEPVMGAGGVVVPPRSYWDKIQAVLARHDILLVADEVICGFGRTGQMFGSQTYGIRPDIMVLSKALTSSYFPMSAVLMNARVYDPVAEESDRIGTFGHGVTASAHPVGAAVAMANLDIIEERGLVANAAEQGAYLQERLRALAGHPLVAEARGVGLIGALELKPGDAPGQRGSAMAAIMQEAGVISRAMGDSMAFCPPLIVGRAEIDLAMDVTERSLGVLEAQRAA